MKKVLVIIFSALFVTFILYFIIEVLIVSNIGPDWESIETETIGTITRISPGRGGGAWFSYISDGKLHEEFDGLDKKGLVVGEKYWIKYCSSCSSTFTSKIKSIPYLPVFTDDESFFETTACITEIYKHNILEKDSCFEVEFLYSIGNERVERLQSLPPNYKKIYTDLAVGQEYYVKVWNKDYRRAIVDLDKIKK